MNFAPITTAIINRVLADTGTGGLRVVGPPAGWAPLIAGGVWGMWKNPKDMTKPYAAFAVNAINPRPTFKSDSFLYTVTFTVYDFAGSGYDRIAPILDRLYGNGIATSGGGVPTYGFHRFVPVLGTNAPYNATCGVMLCQEIRGLEPTDPEFVAASISFGFEVFSQEYT